jgi:hypothetical protein
MHRVTNPSGPSAIHQLQQQSCNTTTLKVSLLIFGLLLIGAALASHMYQVNAIAVYTMGVSGCSLILAVAITSIVQYLRSHSQTGERGAQNSQARILGLDISQLPDDITEREKIIERKRQELLGGATLSIITSLDLHITWLHDTTERFQKAINDREDVDKCWNNIKVARILMDCTDLLLLGNLDKDPVIRQKQKEIFDLNLQLVQLRKTSYRDYIRTLVRDDALLKEAQKYYLESFLQEDQKDLKVPNTLETIVPTLKERVKALAKNHFDIVEMEVLITQIVLMSL